MSFLFKNDIFRFEMLMKMDFDIHARLYMIIEILL